MPDVKVFLGQQICQDPLENFFGCQRRGGTHDNPSVNEFQKNMQALRVINSFARGPAAKGNFTGFDGDYTEVDIQKENKPLPKHKTIRSKL